MKRSFAGRAAVIAAVIMLGGVMALSVLPKNKYPTVRAESSGAGLGPENRYECEKAKCYDATGKKKITNTQVSDKDASGGAVAGSTGGKSFLFENTPEANVIHIAYATYNTATMQVTIRCCR
ncbi:MAG: hypothetical protein IKI42_00340 [Clostridia bacterium]|nr:hypothetical protein [Clostridia bacterium]